jgi:hypothetical protein
VIGANHRSSPRLEEFECGHGFYRKIERLEYRAAGDDCLCDAATLALIVSISSAESDEQTLAQMAQ